MHINFGLFHAKKRVANLALSCWGSCSKKQSFFQQPRLRTGAKRQQLSDLFWIPIRKPGWGTFFFDTSDRRRNRKNMRSARDLRLLASVHRVLNTGLIDISEIFRNILRQKKSQNLNCFSCLIWMAPFGFNMIQRVHLQQILASHRKRLSHRVIVKHGSTRDEFTMNSGGESTRINASKSATPRNKEFQHPKMREKWDDVTPWAILTWPRLCRPSFLLP